MFQILDGSELLFQIFIYFIDFILVLFFGKLVKIFHRYNVLIDGHSVVEKFEKVRKVFDFLTFFVLD